MSKRDIFVSRPSTRNSRQEQFLTRLDEIFDRRNLWPVSIGQTEYPNKAPIRAVRDRMERCDGAMIVGLEQLRVVEGIEKPVAEDTMVEDRQLPTPWNQIEAGMAFMLDLPIMILKEEGVEGGVFDTGPSDRSVHEVMLSDEWLESREFTDPFNEWYEEVLQRSGKG